MKEYLGRIKLDYLRYRSDTRLISIVKLFLTHPGFQAVCYLRLQQYCVDSRKIKIANQLRMIMVRKFALDSVVGNSIGDGLRIEHPVGIVLGGTVKIGKNCTLMHNSTIGERYVDSRSDGVGAVICDNVIIGVGSQILGNILVSDDTIVTNGSILLRSTTPGERIIGYAK